MQSIRAGLIAVVLCVLLCPPAAQAKDSFADRLVRWLDEPGVRVVAVEFYSDYCEPCKAAVPRWEALRKRYQSRGLKLVVVNVDDYESDRQCKTLPWQPDLLICDKGLGESLGVCAGGSCRVPQAFLWSWQGKRLVSGRAHVSEVEKAVRAALNSNPRVLVEVAIKDQGTPVNAAIVRRLLEQEIGRDLKMQVVVSDAERKALQARARETHGSARRESQQCELGQDVSENMVLRAHVYSPRRGTGSLSLSLQQLQQKCAITVVADFSAAHMAIAVRKAAYQLMTRLKQRPPQMPGVRSTGAVSIKEQTIDDAPKKAWNPNASGGNAGIVKFVSTPPGAVVTVAGKTECSATPCSKYLSLGPRRVEMSLPQYLKKTQTVTLTKNATVNWALVEDFAVLSVATNPPGVAISLDGSPIQNPLIKHRVGAGAHQLQVTDRCYNAQTTQLPLTRGQRRQITLNPTPREAAVRVFARDSNGNDRAGTVYVDDKRLGPTFATHKVKLCPGVLTVSVSGYGDWNINLTQHGLVERNTTRINAIVHSWNHIANADALEKPEAPTRATVFEPAQGQLALISFESNPTGALVEVDGKALCKTPCKKALIKGPHRVQMQLARYVAADSALNAQRNQTVRLDLTPDFGTLVVTTQPASLPVWVDGKEHGNSPVTLKGVAAGAHEVMVKSRCHHNKGQQVIVARGKTRQLTISPATRMSAIMVKATDAKKNAVQAKVLVDDKAVGQTYQTIKISVCAKQVAVRDKAHGNWSAALSLKEEQVANFNAKLGTNHDRFQGQWSVDVDKMIASNPAMQAQIKETPQAAEMIKGMMGAMVVTVTKDSLDMKMGDTSNKVSYTVKTDEGNTLVVLGKEEGKDETDEVTITFSDDDHAIMGKAGDKDKMHIVRKTSSGYCGDGKCTTSVGETRANCPKDCDRCIKGDGRCDRPCETKRNSPADCSCGDGICDRGDRAKCPRDCRLCGNGRCDAGRETRASCPQDCKPTKGACGDGRCSGRESCGSCAKDCKCKGICKGKYCVGDRRCSRKRGENCKNSKDCRCKKGYKCSKTGRCAPTLIREIEL